MTEEVINSINAQVRILRKGRAPRQYVLYVRSGSSPPLCLREYTADPRFCVVVSFYEKPQYEPPDSSWLMEGGLSKFDSAEYLLRQHPELLEASITGFFDPDVAIGWKDLVRLFEEGERSQAEIFQASLTAESKGSWPFLVQRRSRRMWRRVTFVEVMAPLFSRSCLHRIYDKFSASYSTWGLEYIWYASSNPIRMLVNDQISMTHATPVDFENGRFYQHLMRHGIDPWQDKSVLRRRYVPVWYSEASIPALVPDGMVDAYLQTSHLLTRMEARVQGATSGIARRFRTVSRPK